MDKIQNQPRILFITSSRIGDAVLSLGALDYLASSYPHAHITVACGPLAVGFFEAAPCVKRIIPLIKKKYNGHWIKLLLEVIGVHWDIVVDFRNSAVSRLLFARKRYIYGPHIDQTRHKVQQAALLLRLNEVPSPRLWFSKQVLLQAESFIPDTTELVLGVGPTANWAGKTWPSKNFVDIVQWLISPGGLMQGARLAVFSAPGEESGALEVLKCLPEDRVYDLCGKTNPIVAAAALARCHFYIGNDSGLMHCAAAAGIPTLGLFGPSYPSLYRPWGDQSIFVSTPEDFDTLTSYDGYDPKTCGCLMHSLNVDMVKESIARNWPVLQKNPSF